MAFVVEVFNNLHLIDDCRHFFNNNRAKVFKMCGSYSFVSQYIKVNDHHFFDI